MAPGKKKSQEYSLNDVTNFLGNKIQNNLNESYNNAKIIEKEELQENYKLLNQGEAFAKNARYLGQGSKKEMMKIIEQYVPEGSRTQILDEVRKIDGYSYKLLSTIENSKYFEKDLRIALDEYEKIYRDPLNSKRKLQVGKSVQYFATKKGEYEARIKGEVEGLASMVEKTIGEIKNYQSGADKNISKGGTTIIAIMATVFGGGVLYALSQTDPSSVTTGAFTGVAASPLIIMTLVGMGIFALFFMLQHKFHE